jgi:hypothetical protein
MEEHIQKTVDQLVEIRDKEAAASAGRRLVLA